MKYVEGRFDQFVDDRKKLSSDERMELIQEYRERGQEMLQGVWDQVKAKVQHTEDDVSIGTGLPYKTEMDHVNRDELPKKSKPTIVPLIAFGIMLVLLLISAVFFNIAVAFGVFFAFISFFGFYAAYKNNGTSYTFFGGTNSSSNRTSGILIGILGLAAVIPLCLSFKIGIRNSMMLMLTAMFLVIGIYLIVGSIKSFSSNQPRYSEEINAEAIAYVRTVGDTGNSTAGAQIQTAGKVLIRTSPLFEYTYMGQTYKATYDRPIDGCNADIDLGPTKICIDPDHPEDIGHQSAKVGAKGVLGAIICIVMVVFLIGAYVMLNTQPAEPAAQAGNGSIFEISEEEITDEMVDARIHSIVGYEDCVWYYKKMHVTITTYDSGNYSIELEDPAFPSICDEHDASYWHDELLVFYAVEEYEGSDGIIRLERTPLLYFNADEHTYIGAHGEYVE